MSDIEKNKDALLSLYKGKAFILQIAKDYENEWYDSRKSARAEKEEAIKHKWIMSAMNSN